VLRVKYRLKKLIKTCPVCGKEFHPTRKEYKTCSTKCGCQIRGGQRMLAKRLRLFCDNCGKEILRKAKTMKDKENFFCDRKCYAEYKQKNTIGPKNSNWKGGISHAYQNKTRHGRGNRLYRKGRYYENRVRKELEADGYYTIRSAGSHGLWDVIAIRQDRIRLIQVKAGDPPRKEERMRMAEFNKHPKIATKEIWRFVGGTKKEISIWHKFKGWIKEYYL
jgi:hypothetical protein